MEERKPVGSTQSAVGNKKIIKKMWAGFKKYIEKGCPCSDCSDWEDEFLEDDEDDSWSDGWDFDPVPEYLQKRCRECGCTDDNPCINKDTGETCGWDSDDICNFCAIKINREEGSNLPF